MRIASPRRGTDVLEQVAARLDSLNDRCAAELVAGLEGMRSGDLTRRVTPVTTLIDPPDRSIRRGGVWQDQPGNAHDTHRRHHAGVRQRRLG